jgi:hypothetical protein
MYYNKCGWQYLYMLQYLQFVGDFRHKILVLGLFLCRHWQATFWPIANMLPACPQHSQLSIPEAFLWLEQPHRCMNQTRPATGSTLTYLQEFLIQRCPKYHVKEIWVIHLQNSRQGEGVLCPSTNKCNSMTKIAVDIYHQYTYCQKSWWHHPISLTKAHRGVYKCTGKWDVTLTKCFVLNTISSFWAHKASLQPSPNKPLSFEGLCLQSGEQWHHSNWSIPLFLLQQFCVVPTLCHRKDLM